MENKSTTNAKIKSKLDNLHQLLEKTSVWKGMALILFAIIILTQIFEISITPKLSFLKSKTLIAQTSPKDNNIKPSPIDTVAISKEVIPENGVILPIKWNDLGKQMIADGVIDEQKFRALFKNGLTNQNEQVLTGNIDKPFVMNQKNSRFILDVLWAFGLANKNDILENGEMTAKEYGGDASKFASTGGWSLAKGAGFSHYSKHSYVNLTPEQQALVEEVSKNIYRPCCGNSTHFPDCNHGMAMLGLLELMAANNVSEKDMYKVALEVNSLWFPQTYIDLATYFKEQGKNWDQVDPKEVLGTNYSSAKGYQTTKQKIKSLPKAQTNGGGCGA